VFDPATALARVQACESEEELSQAQRDLTQGYPNTYTVTKSMGEHLVVKQMGSVPLLIFRPSIVGCAWAEPYPGWIDAATAAGAVYLACGMGLLQLLQGDPDNVADIIPVDVCCHQMLAHAASVGQQRRQQGATRQVPVVHSSSSARNPMRWRTANEHIPAYWQKNPPAGQLRPAQFQMIASERLFAAQWALRYTVPLAAAQKAASMSGNPDWIAKVARVATYVAKAEGVVDAYRPFTTQEWTFHSQRLQSVLKRQASGEGSVLCIDPCLVRWEKYCSIFCYGLRKWVLKEDLISIEEDSLAVQPVCFNPGKAWVEYDSKRHRVSFPGLLEDLNFACNANRSAPNRHPLGRWVSRLHGDTHGKLRAGHVPRSPGLFANGQHQAAYAQVLSSPRIKSAMEAEVEACGGGEEARQATRERAAGIMARMGSTFDQDRTIRGLAYLFKKIWRQIYDSISLNVGGVEAIRGLLGQGKGTAVVFMPTHRSYVDFLMMSYLCFDSNLPVPHICAREDFLNMSFVSQLLRQSGAYFIKNGVKEDPLYAAVFATYTQHLMLEGQPIEFFLEGTRSRSGKQLPPKLGMLGDVMEPYFEGRLREVHLVPVGDSTPYYHIWTYNPRFYSLLPYMDI